MIGAAIVVVVWLLCVLCPCPFVITEHEHTDSNTTCTEVQQSQNLPATRTTDSCMTYTAVTHTQIQLCSSACSVQLTAE